MQIHAPVSIARIQHSSLDQIRAGISVPQYERHPANVGVLHLGPGAFHRAHQASYFDEFLAKHGGNWGICGASLRNASTRDLLSAQDCLYTLAIRDTKPVFRIVGSVFEMLAATDQSHTILQRIADPSVRIVSMTITEKGYCLTPDGDLDVKHPDVQHDIANSEHPVSAIGYLVAGYRLRRSSGNKAFTSLSCDNLVGNGNRLAKAVIQLASEVDKDLAGWIEANARFPNTMVDSITPATDDDLLNDVESEIGLADAAPVQREAFTQWVVEDRFADGRPPLEDVGVTFTSDVEPFEQAKLRILNGLHSTLAYVGLLYGYTTVAEAMQDLAVKSILGRMVRNEILGSLELNNLDSYVSSVVSRFENPAIEYSLMQIAGDSSQKLPFRIMGTVRDNLRDGRPVANLALCIASWLHVVRQEVAEGNILNDPLNAQLQECAKNCTGDSVGDLKIFSRLDSVLAPDVMSAEPFYLALTDAYEAIENTGRPGLTQ